MENTLNRRILPVPPHNAAMRAGVATALASVMASPISLAAHADENEAVAGAADEEENAENVLPTKPLDVRRMYFTPADLENGALYGAAVEELADAKDAAGKAVWNLKLERNYDVNTVWPTGYGMMFVPVRERADKDTGAPAAVHKVIIAAVPVIGDVMQNDEGRSFLERAMRANFAAKLISAFNSDTNIAAPLSVADFLKRRPRVAANETYDEVAPEFIKTLKEKAGFTGLTKAIFKMVLSSATFAQSQYPSVPQPIWENIIKAMIARGGQLKKDTAGIANWIGTRAEKKIETADADRLAALFGTMAAATAVTSEPTATPPAA